ncbi:MAG: hypothetical protein IAE87_17000 [Rhodobacteraceae bacterium]|nr:hypothetical protein [Paracoccaceae bacterium]
MSRHLADKRKPSAGGRMRAFLRIEREGRATWHRPHTPSGANRLIQYLRIARGRTV